MGMEVRKIGLVRSDSELTAFCPFCDAENSLPLNEKGIPDFRQGHTCEHFFAVDLESRRMVFVKTEGKKPLFLPDLPWI